MTAGASEASGTPLDRPGDAAAAPLRFEKWQGAGNDFILIARRDLPPGGNGAQLARPLCARRTAVGADGLIVYDAPTLAAEFWNPDGSAAAFCGNGARCLGALLLEASGRTAIEFRFGATATRAWRPAARAETPPREGLPAEIAVTVPPPQRRDCAVPRALLDSALGEHAAELREVAWIDAGVPHLVLRFRGTPEWLLRDEGVVARSGVALRRAPHFAPQGTNVDFLCRAPGGAAAAWRVRTYERGVEAETLACGTGIVAAALLLIGAREAAVTIEARSGAVLRVEREVPAWILQGPAQRVFRGTCGLPQG